MDELLLNKTALITGGTRGIGKAIALRFAGAGAHVVLIGTNAERGKKAVAEIEAGLRPEQKALFYQADVSKAAEVEVFLKEVLDTFGQVDILVNNAGITRDNLLIRLSENDWEEVLSTNLKSVYNTCKAFVRPMMKARYGKIINITSVVGLTGNAGQTNYAASKAGMIGFTKSLAQEMASRGLCINCIAPGFIKTDMTDGLTEVQKEGILKQVPMQRLGLPEEIANAALFLASPLSDYITGQVLTVDGGMVMA